MVNRCKYREFYYFDMFGKHNEGHLGNEYPYIYFSVRLLMNRVLVFTKVYRNQIISVHFTSYFFYK